MNRIIPPRRSSRAYPSILLSLILVMSPLLPTAAHAAEPSAGARPPESRADLPAERDGSHKFGEKGIEHTAGAPARLAAPAAVAPNLVATKTDSFTDVGGGAAAPGSTITYTVTIVNNGPDAADNVTLTDTVDPNTSIVPGSPDSTPIAFNDAYNVIANVRIQPNAAQGLLANDINPETGNNTSLTASGPATGPANGEATVNGNGSFSYNPNAGFTGTDSFTYTVTDSTGESSTGTVSLNVGNGAGSTTGAVIWFVDDTAPAGGDGRLTNPFNCYTGANASCFSQTAADDPGDFIFLFDGAYTGGYQLLNGESLIGQDASATLASLAGMTVQAYSNALPATDSTAGGVNITTSAATNAIPLGQGNTLRGFTVGNTTGAKIFGNNFGTLTAGNNTMPDVTLSGTGQALNLTNGAFAASSAFSSVATTSSGTSGLTLTSVGGTVAFGSTTVSGHTGECLITGSSTASINYGNTSCTGGANGVSLSGNTSGTRTFGTLSVSGGSGNAFVHVGGGGNVTVNGAASLSSGAADAVVIQNAANGNLINFAGGATVNKTGAGGEAVWWSGTNTGATLTFSTLAVTSGGANAAGLNLSGGGTVNVTNAVGSSIGVTSGPAVVADSVALNANFTSINSSGGTNGVSLTNVSGTSNFGTGALNGATGATFLVSGGPANVTYNGTIGQTNAQRAVDVQGKTAGTVAFGGAITATTTTANAVHLASNTGATINFTGGLNLTTTSGVGFNATGGGTVNATQNNTSIVNTLTTTTGTALNIANTNIGASGLTFRSISANGAANGIVLNNTGTGGGSGGLTVTGSGSVGSGGTVQNGAIGISLASTRGPSFTRMQLNNFSDFAIRGSSVVNFTMSDTVINGTNGDNDATDDGSVRFTELTGMASITGGSISGGHEDNLSVVNTTGTLDRITVSGVTFGANSLNFGSDGALFEQAGSSVLKATVTNCTFTSTRGDHVHYNATGNTPGGQSGDFVLTSNNFSNNHAGTVSGAGGIRVVTGASGSTPSVTYNISNNVINGARGTAIGATEGAGAGTLQGVINNNDIGTAAVANSGSLEGSGISIVMADLGSHIVNVTNNDVRQYNNNGIFVQAGGGASASSGTLHATVTGNAVGNFGNNAAVAPPAGRNGFQLNSGTFPGDTFAVCLDLGGAGANANSLAGSGDGVSATGTDFRLRQRQNTTVRLPGYPGAGNDDAAVVSYLQGRNAGSETGTASNNSSGWQGGAACTPPVLPSAPDTIEVTSAEGSPGEVQNGTPATEEALAATDSSTSSVNGVTRQPFVSSASYSYKTMSTSQAGGQKQIPQPAPQLGPPTSGDDGGTPTPQPPVVMGNNLTWNVGTLPAGQSVTITFQVTVETPFVAPQPQVSNQGTISFDGGANVLTDDPSVGGASDPTVTPVAVPPDIFVRDARQFEPSAGTNDIVFTVVLSSPALSPLNVNFTTADEPPGAGKAVAGQDYTAASGAITFFTGERLKTVSIPVLSDADPEPDETFLLNLTGATGSFGSIADNQATGTITVNTPGTILISELRTSGPAGAGDDFVEIYNITDSPVTVSPTGWALVAANNGCSTDPVIVGVIPNGTVIPARGHYLFVGSQYSLSDYGGAGAATGDQTLTADLETDANLALFTVSDLVNLSSAAKLDGVGLSTNTGGVCDLLREGATLPGAAGSASQHSFFRKLSSGRPQDRGNNAADFQIVSTTPAAAVGNNLAPALGAPGPQNIASPIQRNDKIKASLIDPQQSSGASPNSVRKFCSPMTPGVEECDANRSQFGTFSIRRRWTNNTGENVTRLRFRLVNVTVGPAPAGTADLRAISSLQVTGIAVTGGGTVDVEGTTLEAPTQALGGGYNSTLSAGTVSLAAPLAPGASINLQFLLGVQQPGAYAFFVNVEAGPPPAGPLTASASRQPARSKK